MAKRKIKKLKMPHLAVPPGWLFKERIHISKQVRLEGRGFKIFVQVETLEPLRTAAALRGISYFQVWRTTANGDAKPSRKLDPTGFIEIVAWIHKQCGLPDKLQQKHSGHLTVNEALEAFAATLT